MIDTHGGCMDTMDRIALSAATKYFSLQREMLALLDELKNELQKDAGDAPWEADCSVPDVTISEWLDKAYARVGQT